MASINEIARALEACFGCDDRKFAMHPSETKEARKLLAFIADQEVPFVDVMEAARRVLVGWECRQDHIEAELARMRKLESWL